MKKSSIFKQLVIMTAITAVSAGTYAQDTRYTQTHNAPLRVNPALMANNKVLKGILNYRTQWATIDDGFTTFRFTGMYPLIKDEQGKLDVGLDINNDVAGAFTTLNVSGAVSYSLKISDAHRLGAGLILGFGQKTVDLSGQTFDEQYVLGSYDATNPSNEMLFNEQVMYPDLGGGLMWFYGEDDDPVNAYFGVAAYHQNTPDESIQSTDSKLPVLTNIHGGVKIIGDKLDFTPNMRYSKQGGAEEYSIGTYIDYKLNETMKIPFGLWYRYKNQDALAFMLGFEHEYFNVAYSYDLGSFDLINSISGLTTHEVTLGFTIAVGGSRGAAPLTD
ncbi:MAG: PorP/SprF family type IX secretion system membrane protein [Flavobacteriales bacterium]|nr:PorP/SprF family type IX secretion system membrane protein [Flavobacteriales bacterium]